MKRLLLVGGGHAHVEVLRSIKRRPIPRTEVLLVSTGRFAAYTGMVPGYLAGRYTSSNISFDLDALTRAAGGSFVDGTVEQVDGAARTVHVNGQRIAFDACSIDIGSAAAGSDVAGVRENAVPLRPLANALALRPRFDALAIASRNEAQCVVVGGGAGESRWPSRSRLAPKAGCVFPSCTTARTFCPAIRAARGESLRRPVGGLVSP